MSHYYTAVLEAATRKLNRHKKLGRLNEEIDDYIDDENEYNPDIFELSAYNKMDIIREMVSDEDIVNELIQYMSENQLDEFADTLIKNFDIDYHYNQ